MNIKIKVIAALAIFAVSLSRVQAYAEGVFLCMRANESVAITADENNNLKYIEMKASNDAVVYPQISTDGNTYLPFRFICEAAGLKDAADIPAELPEGCFRYLDEAHAYDGIPKVEIRCGGKYYYHNIDESFQYETDSGEVRTVSIYNIRGSIYMPMAYLAKITGSSAIWQEDLGQIMFISGDLDRGEFLQENNMLRRDKEIFMEFDYFNNNIIDTPLYLKSDGITVQNLSLEITDFPKVKSVTRSGRDIYYINENGVVSIKSEDINDGAPFSFTDKDGNSFEVLADTVMVVQNKLYGVQISANGEKYGRLFSANLDGTEFGYLNEQNVYNLILKKDGIDLYMFYCEAATRDTIHMIKVSTMDDYEIEITNHNHENVFSDIKQFAVGDKTIYWLDESGALHITDTEYAVEDIEIVRVDDENTKLFTEAGSGETLNNIISMNFDYINNVLYVTQVDDTYKVFYYTNKKGAFTRLESGYEEFNGVALFSNLGYRDEYAKAKGYRIVVTPLIYENGTIKVIESEVMRY